ncbi:MAG TPA: hypothetical protein PK205_18870 [Promineifilum sp.]|nr:hypothetical protein [Promineifilum sp.]
MGKMIRRAWVFGVAALAAVGIMSVQNEPEFVLISEASTTVYEDYPTDGPPRAKVVGVMNEGDEALIIHTRYAKDAAYYKVRLQDGREGYVGSDGRFEIAPAKKD